MLNNSKKTKQSSLSFKTQGKDALSSSDSLKAKSAGTKQKQASQIQEDMIDPFQHVYENVWRQVFIFTSIIGLFLIYKVYRFHTEPMTANIPKGSINDFWISVAVALIIALIKFIIKKQLQEKVVGLLSYKRAKTFEQGIQRANQICKWIFDFFYYSCATILGYLIIKDQPFLPPTLFGEGNCENIFMQYPYVPEIPYLKYFYLVQAGTHLYSLIYQFVAKRSDPKFYEFALHHTLTMFLIWFSYMMNLLLIGTVVLILHDPGDVVLIALRVYSDYKYKQKVINIFLFFLALPIWVYTRNIIFPSCVIKTCVQFYTIFDYNKFPRDIFHLPFLYMFSMLGMLAVMHLYWTFFFVKAFIRTSKGKEKNGYDS